MKSRVGVREGKPSRAERLLARVVRSVRAGEDIPFSERSIRCLVRDGVEMAARSEGISERTFRRECEQAGLTPRALVRLIRCEVLLSAMGVPQEELGAVLGYSSVRSVQRFFREEVGMRVRRFRRVQRAGTFEEPDRARIASNRGG